MKCSPSLLAKFIDDERFQFLYLDEFFLFDVLGIVLKQIKEGLLIFLLYFFQHLFALCIKVPPHVELLFLPLIILFLFFDR
jgi:hypothetical protein